MDRNGLQRLTKEELIDLVLRLQRPDKTSRTSSKPPSTDRKESQEKSKPGGAKPGHEGHSRRLADDPDSFHDYLPMQCDRCGLPFPDNAERQLIGEYDDIELPPVRPDRLKWPANPGSLPGRWKNAAPACPGFCPSYRNSL